MQGGYRYRVSRGLKISCIGKENKTANFIDARESSPVAPALGKKIDKDSLFRNYYTSRVRFRSVADPFSLDFLRIRVPTSDPIEGSCEGTNIQNGWSRDVMEDSVLFRYR